MIHFFIAEDLYFITVQRFQFQSFLEDNSYSLGFNEKHFVLFFEPYHTLYSKQR